MVKKVLYIEGEPGRKGNYLRQAFSELLEKEVQNKPAIKLCGNTDETAKAFNSSESPSSWALIDMDGVKSERTKKIEKYKLQEKEERLFFMIQEMEAWFLSQPTILTDFYKIDKFDKLKNRIAEEIENPAELLENITKATPTKKGRYTKLEHDHILLPLLDSKKLCNDFEDFKKLVTALNQ
jgi:hypothetical protein